MRHDKSKSDQNDGEEQEHLTAAIHRSTIEASIQEQEHLTEAILRSKIEATPQYADEVVVSRLTDCSKNIVQTLFRSDHLIPCISRVTDAECEVQPKWANGAVLLVPLMQDDISGKGIELRNFHVVHYRKDYAFIKQALATIPKRQDRPKVKEERNAKISRKGGMSDVASCAGGSGASHGSCTGGMSDIASCAGADNELLDGAFEIIIEKTFIMARPVPASSEEYARTI
jgi:DNA-binding phage protein